MQLSIKADCPSCQEHTFIVDANVPSTNDIDYGSGICLNKDCNYTKLKPKTVFCFDCLQFLSIDNVSEHRKEHRNSVKQI